MLDVGAGKQAVVKATALPFQVIMEALDAFAPANLQTAFERAAGRFTKLARKASRNRAENIELDQLDSALGCLLGEKGLLVRAGRWLWMLSLAEKADLAARRRSSKPDSIVFLLEAAVLPWGEQENPAPAARRLARLLTSLASLRQRGWLQGKLFPRTRLESVQDQLRRLLAQSGGAADEQLAEALAQCPPHAARQADILEGWLRFSIWLAAWQLAEGCLVELRRLAVWVRDSLAVASGPATG